MTPGQETKNDGHLNSRYSEGLAAASAPSRGHGRAPWHSDERARMIRSEVQRQYRIAETRMASEEARFLNCGYGTQ